MPFSQRLLVRIDPAEGREPIDTREKSLSDTVSYDQQYVDIAESVDVLPRARDRPKEDECRHVGIWLEQRSQLR